MKQKNSFIVAIIFASKMPHCGKIFDTIRQNKCFNEAKIISCYDLNSKLPPLFELENYQFSYKFEITS